MLSLEIENPDRANALTPAILDDLARACSPAEVGDARAIILSGAGERHFSSGVDLSPVEPDHLPAYMQREEARLGTAAAALEASPVPVIASIDGAAFGGALELAAACDWRVARPAARLGMPAGRIGVAYSLGGLRRFVSLMGPARARRLFLSAATLTAEDGLTLGLVDELAPPDGSARDAAWAAADGVAACSPAAVAAMRSAIAALVPDPPDHAEEEAAAARAAVFASEDFREGLAAFRDKRTAEFTGD